ncbi:DUF2339 domain-containing protein [Sphingomonas jatrophae]|uniref:Uncharacterized membrane protein n=1 Tax=Sphingomonas jatrophae TaxID=1166337 RepID=A0A1I6KZ12_9SPHN|nr:DUF2339 domain-containing protein [Sphingomonas jatrophae]SFR96451.1 Uncharacterized membrane protein [Sphingomonas jatrophae]
MRMWTAIAGALAGWVLDDFDVGGFMLGGLLGLLLGWAARRTIRAEVAAAVAPLAEQIELLRAGAPAVQTYAVPEPATVPQPASEPHPVAVLPPEPVEMPAPPASASERPGPPAPRTPGIVESAIAAARHWLLGGNTIVRAGLVILFVGLSFLASWAASAGLFPIELRLALVGAVGIALLAAGFRTRHARPGFGLALQGGGIATIYLTLFAAGWLFGVVPILAALPLMILVCAFGCALALLQRSQALAVTAFAGGFAVPMLLSGGGSAAPVFAYFTILNLAILFIARHRGWRLLNLTGFVATFGLAGIWGATAYAPGDYPAAQIFLIANVLIYVATAVLYTRVTPGRTGLAIDTTLLFGPALAGFGLQAGLVHDRPFATAFSALCFAAIYVGTAFAASRSRRESPRVMIETMLAIGIGFVTLAVPLALGARWTSAAWALEGAGALWVGMRQARWMPRLFGLALQGVATLVFLTTLEPVVSSLPLVHGGFVGALLIALAWGASAWWLRGGALAHSGSRAATAWAKVEAELGRPLFLLGFGFWWLAWTLEAVRALPTAIAGNLPVPVVSDATRVLLSMLAYLLSAAAAQWLARSRQWDVAAWPSRVSLVALVLGFVGQIGFAPMLSFPSWLLWIAAIGLHLTMLYRNDRDAAGDVAARGLRRIAHVGGVWLATAMLADMLWFAILRADLWGTSWAGVAFLVSATAMLVGLTLWAAPALRGGPARWPLDRHAADYGWIAGALIAALVFVAAVGAALFASGRVDPLPYLPLLNPVDLALLLALGALLLWRRTMLAVRPALPASALLESAGALGALAGLTFLIVNMMWLRAAHQLLGVGWSGDALLGSAVVQTGLAILWTVIALGLMVLATNRGWRRPWLVGAALLALTVIKLLLIDMDAAGGGARIVTFIGVGVLMLVVGYAAPLPPRARHEEVPA